MSNKKHIDRIFKEQLKNFEATPPSDLWKKIELELHPEKQRKPILPLWWTFAGVAALLALFIAFSPFYNSNSNIKPSELPSVVDSPDSSWEETRSSSTSTLENSTERIQNPSSNANPEMTASTPVNTQQSAVDNQTLNTTKAGVASKSKHQSSTSAQRSPDQFIAIQNAVADNSSKKPSKTILDDKTETRLTEYEKNWKQENSNTLKFDELIVAASQADSNTAVDEQSLKSMVTEDVFTQTETIEEAIAKIKALEDKEVLAAAEDKVKGSRWSIAPNIAPVYYNSFGQGSSIDPTLVNNSKTSEITMSYGVSGAYAITDKLKVRAGIHQVDLGSRTNEVISFRTLDPLSSNAESRLSYVTINDNASGLSFISTQAFNKPNTPAALNTQKSTSIEQRFGFIEMPLEIEYTIIDSKFGMHLVGGFSTLFLNKNEIYGSIDGLKARIGEANNINSTSYSANFGVGLNYNLSPNIHINLEPMFKYQMNTFSQSSGEVKPYFIGLYTGLRYKF